MRKRSENLSKFIAIAAAEEQKTGRLVGQSRRQLNEHVDRLGELNAFRHEYLGKGLSSGSYDSAHYKDYQGFLSRLDAAVRSQKQIIADSEQAVEIHRKRWMEKRQRLESLERVREQYRAEEHQQEQRQEQRVLDDLPPGPSAFNEDET